MRNPGYRFEKEFERWLDKSRDYIARIPDARTLRLRSTKQVPADYYSVGVGGIGELWECKSTSLASFPFANVKPHQEQHLEAHDNAGGGSYIVVEFSRSAKAYVLAWEGYWLHKELLLATGRKSMTERYMKTFALKTLIRKTPSELPNETEARYYD